VPVQNQFLCVFSNCWFGVFECSLLELHSESSVTFYLCVANPNNVKLGPAPVARHPSSVKSIRHTHTHTHRQTDIPVIYR